MSLRLTIDSDDIVADCKGNEVWIHSVLNDFSIGPQDFCELVMYFMKNTDVELGDIRFELKERIENLVLTEGFNGPRSRRFEKGI